MSDTTRIYELGYLFMPSVGDERAVELAAELKSFVTDHGGEIIAEGEPERIDLAYQMIKVIDNKNIRIDEAYFGWIKFEGEPTLPAELKALVELHRDVVRHLLFKTVRENTFMLRKSVKRKSRSSETDAEGDELIAEVDQTPLEESVVVEEEPTESEILDTKIETLIPDSE